MERSERSAEQIGMVPSPNSSPEDCGVRAQCSVFNARCMWLCWPWLLPQVSNLVSYASSHRNTLQRVN